MTPSSLLLLREYFGHASFRPSQEEAIDHLMNGHDLLAVMPTGAGKSVCYQIPALLMEGVTLVISPLISLMKDQVTALVQNGISAAYINSSLSGTEYYEILRRAAGGEYKLLYVAPERLQTPSFLQFCVSISISMVTVDEAHCISQWGQDFRPSYLKIADFVGQLPHRPVLSAFTATATERVRRDIVTMLRLRTPHRIVTSFDRENLYFEVLRPLDKEAALLRLLRQRQGSCGIIYCLTRKSVETVCTFLQERNFSATRYHGGLSAEERQSNQDDFLFDRKEIMVATNAFGMGIDKSNVSFVIHYHMPASLESYYQEAGRAGRDGTASDCILLFREQDTRLAQYLIDHADPPESEDKASKEMAESLKRNRIQRLRMMEHYCTGTGCLRQFLLNYFGEPLEHSCGKCSSCLSGYEDIDVTEEAQKLLSCVIRVERAGYQAEKNLVFQILRGECTPPIQQLKLDTLTTFGLMKAANKAQLEQLTLRLEERGMLTTSGEAFLILSPTERAKSLLWGRQKLTLRRPKEIRPIRPASKPGVNPVLYQKLVELRKKLAHREGIPPAMLFSDTVLREICRRRPTNKKEFRKIPGVPFLKAEKYSKDFIALLQKE